MTLPAWVTPLIFLGFSAELSNFGGAVGLGVLPLGARRRLEILGTFVAMEAIMPAVGLLVGARVSGAVGTRASLFAGLVLVAAGFMGLCSLVLTIIGLELGRHLGKVVGERSELFSGVVLVLAGIFVAVHG